MNKIKCVFFLLSLSFLGAFFQSVCAQNTQLPSIENKDSLRYPFKKESGGLYLENPIKVKVYYDPVTGKYLIEQKIGNYDISPPIYLNRDEYVAYVTRRRIYDYYKEKSKLETEKRQELKPLTPKEEERKKEGIIPSLSTKVNSRLFESIFGGRKIELIPQGYVQLEFGALYQYLDDPRILKEQRSNITMDLQQRIQLGIIGRVGRNIQISTNYDTQATFAFENKMNFGYTGQEDDILKKIEYGNVSMPLSTSLIQGAQTLFGVKTQLQFGKTFITGIFSEQKSQMRTGVAQGGGALRDFDLRATQYEAYQNFYLGQYFYENYDRALSRYPLVQSNVQITKIEVWRGRNQRNVDLSQARNLVALAPMAMQGETLPNNNQDENYNSVKSIAKQGIAFNEVVSGLSALGYRQGSDFVAIENARLLNPSEYTMHPQLGYLMLKQPLSNNESIAVSYEYTTQDGQIHRVGELTRDVSPPQTLIAKLISVGQATEPTSPLWPLMMKNIYNLEANDIDKEDFRLQLFWALDGGVPIDYIPEAKQEDQSINQGLLELLHLDRLTQNGEVYSDGLFDFVPGITIDPSMGKLIFTTAEPFGNYLKNRLIEKGLPNSVIDKYVYEDLYTKSISGATVGNVDDKYLIKAQYKSGGVDGIPLGAVNIPKGSVKVTAGGKPLEEDVDYTIDYIIGRLVIINPNIKASGLPIKFDLENQAAFNLQKKRFMGLNVEHRFSDNFILGATVLNYSERPLAQRANFGVEPLNNTIFGANVMYNKDAPYLTRWIDKIPLISTQAPSRLSFTAEAAYLSPGINKNTYLGGEPTSYIDDFENAQNRIDLRDPSRWFLSSVPGGMRDVNLNSLDDKRGLEQTEFNGNKPDGDLSYGYNRGMLSWYIIDPVFYSGGSHNISVSETSKHSVRRVFSREIFTEKQIEPGASPFINTLDLSFYPNIRGPYNFNPEIESAKDRWGGLMRALPTTNFEQNNIEYIEFWMMDPYADADKVNQNQAELLIHLGNVSEDILKDNQKQFENGLPKDASNQGTRNSGWGKTPEKEIANYIFETQGNELFNQDLGYNGLTDKQEADSFPAFSEEKNPISQQIDPAADNYIFYLDDRFNASPLGQSIVERYRYFRGVQGNTASGKNAVSLAPDIEDVDGDGTMDRLESYYEYRLKLDRADLENVGKNHIVDKKEVSIGLDNGQSGRVTWYQVRIPIDQVAASYGSIQSFRNIRFLRMILKGTEQTTTLRFATLGLVRSSWRRYDRTIASKEQDIEGRNLDATQLSNLSIGAVNIEENSRRNPPYVIPPGIERDSRYSNATSQLQNEQSMQLRVMGIQNGEGDARGVFKSAQLDLRRYKKLRLFVHAEDLKDPTNNRLDNDLRFFIRAGSDLSENYYEYEAPLKYTDINARTAEEVWPKVNEVNVLLEDWVNLKTQRNKNLAPFTQRFERPNKGGQGQKIIVKGRPTLERVRYLMLGVRNASSQTKDVLLWVDALRLSGLDNKGAWAAQARVDVQLADVANVSIGGGFRQAGFGGLDQTIVDRSQVDRRDFNLQTTVNVETFMPKNWRLRLPFSYTHTQSFVKPKYSPIDTDILFKRADNKEQINDLAQDTERTRSFSLLNVRRERSGKTKPKFYDVENFSLSYSYRDSHRKDVNTAYRIRKELQTSLDYSYNFPNRVYEPFKNLKMVQDSSRYAKYFQWIKAFNLNPKPKRLSFRTEIIRSYDEFMYRDISSIALGGKPVSFSPVFSRNFRFNWRYNIGFDFTRSLRLDINTYMNRSVDRVGASDAQGRFMIPDKEMIWMRFFDTGRPMQYHQQWNLSWKTPINLLPYLHWVDVTTSYRTDYDWRNPSQGYKQQISTQGTQIDLGNVLQNGNTFGINGNLDFRRLYQDFKVFKDLDARLRKHESELQAQKEKQQIRVDRHLKKGQSLDSEKGYEAKTKLRLKDYGFMLASSIKGIQFNYTRTEGTTLPGFLPDVGFWGVGQGGPSLGFILGQQRDYTREFYRRGWITNEPISQPYLNHFNESFNASMELEPIKSLKINVTFNRMHQWSKTRYGFNIDRNPALKELNNDAFTQLSESYSRTENSLFTSFRDPVQLFDRFQANTRILSARLGRGTPLNAAGYAGGYSKRSQAVVIPAFLAAYLDRDPLKISLNPVRRIPLPNWNMIYSGLMDNRWFNKRFDRFDVQHAYQSVTQIGGISANLNYHKDPGGKDPEYGDYYLPKTYTNIVIAETFAPLIGLDLTFKNRMQLRAAYQRSRMMNFSLSNYSLMEESSSEYIAGMGYNVKDLKMKFRYRNRMKTIKSDLNLRADFLLKDNRTTIRKLLENKTDVTAGQYLFSIRGTADYNFSQNFNVSLFYEQQVNRYKMANAFPLTRLKAGVRLRFTFN